MGGLGLCLCCKTDQLLTEHYVKEIKEKVMICRDCHDVMDGYMNLIERYSQLLVKDRQPQVGKGPSPAPKNVDEYKK